jgi:hypothetical protein
LCVLRLGRRSGCEIMEDGALGTRRTSGVRR